MNNLKGAFDQIHASEQLKNDTMEFLRTHKKEPVGKWRFFRIPAIVIACLLCLFAGAGAYGFYSSATAYISIDVNPSIELGVNRWNRVVSVKAYNDDGKAVVETISLTGKDYQTAIEELLEDQSFRQYLGDQSDLTFTVSSDNDKTQTRLISGIESSKGYGQYNGSCEGVGLAIRSEAHANGLSCGKYKAYLTLKDYDSEITVEECQNLTMRELHDRIETCSGEEHGHEDSQGSNNQNESGTGKGTGNGNCSGTGSGNGNGNGSGSGNGNGSDSGNDNCSGNGSCSGTGKGNGNGDGTGNGNGHGHDGGHEEEGE